VNAVPDLVGSEWPENTLSMVTSGTLRAGTAASGNARRGRLWSVQEDQTAVGSQVMGRMVLVVDDDEGVRAVMATALEDDGWTVETAENGRTALETLNVVRPEAIILDLRMPVMDGLTFATRYREFPEPRAPLILLSATVSESAVAATGAVTGLRKPVDLNVLLDTVRAFAAEQSA
jgi:two-component system, chemotaxis family, chemotaxis protein CheY